MTRAGVLAYALAEIAIGFVIAAVVYRGITGELDLPAVGRLDWVSDGVGLAIGGVILLVALGFGVLTVVDEWNGD